MLKDKAFFFTALVLQRWFVAHYELFAHIFSYLLVHSFVLKVLIAGLIFPNCWFMEISSILIYTILFCTLHSLFISTVQVVQDLAQRIPVSVKSTDKKTRVIASSSPSVSSSTSASTVRPSQDTDGKKPQLNTSSGTSTSSSTAATTRAAFTTSTSRVAHHSLGIKSARASHSSSDRIFDSLICDDELWKFSLIQYEYRTTHTVYSVDIYSYI